MPVFCRWSANTLYNPDALECKLLCGILVFIKPLKWTSWLILTLSVLTCSSTPQTNATLCVVKPNSNCWSECSPNKGSSYSLFKYLVVISIMMPRYNYCKQIRPRSRQTASLIHAKLLFVLVFLNKKLHIQYMLLLSITMMLQLVLGLSPSSFGRAKLQLCLD